MFGNMSAIILTQNYIIFNDLFLFWYWVSSYFLYLKLSMVVMKKCKKDVKISRQTFRPLMRAFFSAIIKRLIQKFCKDLKDLKINSNFYKY